MERRGRPPTQTREDLIREISSEVNDARVLDALRRVPREAFVPEDLRYAAYENRPQPIGHDQTISQPLMVALMTQALLLTGEETVLEIGTGSGYQAAVLSLLARHVITVERVTPLAEEAERRLERLGYANIEVHAVDEVLGWPDGGPYDAIAVTAAAPEVPRALLSQLAMGGRLAIPVGSRALQELVRITKTPQGAQRHNLGPCRFVLLLGSAAWPQPR